MKRVLIVLPTAWDRRQLQGVGRWRQEYEIVYADPTDEDCPSDFDILSFIDRMAGEFRGKIDGVTSSSDYPGATVAAAIATQLGLPGSTPETVMRCSHKYYSRIAQREAVPEATTDFALVDPDKPGGSRLEITFPCFIKPVKGAFSVLARRVNSAEELGRFLAQPAVQEFRAHYMYIFNQLVRRYSTFEINGGYFIAEELLHGHQVTVEGYCHRQEAHVLAIVDSVMFPGTGSFRRFDYPSSLARGVQERMADIACRAIQHLGLNDSLFNIEMIYDSARDRISIVEVNPRMSGQFADLYEKVDGTNSYEIALALATGRSPRVRRRQGAFRTASSFPLRVFESVHVMRAPDEDDIRAVESMFPGTLVWLECQSGQALAEFEGTEDGQSYRYAVINMGGPDPDTLAARFDQVVGRLGFTFARAP